MKRALMYGLVLGACVSASPAHAATSSGVVQDFFAATFEERLKDSPEFATTVGRHDYDDRWSDLSAGGRAAVHHHLEARLSSLAALPSDGLTDDERLSIRLMQYQIQSDLAAEDLETHLLRLQQLYGLHVRVYLTIDRMPAHTRVDYDNILARLRAVPAYVNQNIEILNESIGRGLTQP